MTVPLPSSFVDCAVLVAVGWGATATQVDLLRPPVREAATQMLKRITFPAFIFQSLAASSGLLGYTAQVTIIATLIHMLLSVATTWFITRGQIRRQQALLGVLSLGYQAESWAVAWCSVMWGVAGAQAACMVACTAAAVYPMLTFAAGRYAAMGIPADLKHADGGSYTGQWSRSGKDGLGTYWYKNGARYEGWWKENMKHGRGVYQYADGGRFEGEFSNGARNGIGVRIWPHGRVKAAVFKDNKRVRDVELADAANVMEAANEAAVMARRVQSSRITPADAVQRALLNGPVITVCVFVLAAASSVPVTETMEIALSTAASIHIPLSLLLLGASIPKSLPEKRHVPQIRTIIAVRLLSALAVAAGTLMCATQSNGHAVRSAAISACLLSPVSSQALQQAKEWRLSKSLVAGVTVASMSLSVLSMGCFSLQAWAKDVIPVFIPMSVVPVNTFALVDHCFLQFFMLSLIAYFAPRLFLRRVVRMTFTAESVASPGKHGRPQSDTATSGNQNPGSASAFSVPLICHRKMQPQHAARGKLRSVIPRVPSMRHWHSKPTRPLTVL